ncbi:MAG: hypothetical protein ACYS47_04815, partial [Planctomycetota bacterium]
TPTPKARPAAEAPEEDSGEKAVGYSQALKKLKGAKKAESADEESAGRPVVGVRTVAGKSFRWRNGTWVDQDYDEKGFEGKTVKVEYMSAEYFDLLKKKPVLGPFFALGKKVKVLHEGVLYEVTVPEKKE